MWQADKIIYRNEDDFIRAYQGDTLMWERPTFVLYYTSSDGQIITPREGTLKGGSYPYSAVILNIVSNTYENGQGRIVCDGDITIIDPFAFYNQSRLTSITLPESVYLIHNNAFSSSGLTSITLPESVTYIGDTAFRRTGLTSVYIPKNVSHLGKNPFCYCSDLDTITVDPENTTYRSSGNKIYSGNTIVVGCNNSTGITGDVGDSAFAGCSGLTGSLSLGSVGESAFNGCTGITSVRIGDSIGDYAFSSCTGITSLTLEEGVHNIGDSAFNCCTGITSVHLPRYAWFTKNPFVYCSELGSITGNCDNFIVENNAVIYEYDGGDDPTTYELIVGCKNTVIPNYVESIEDYAFAGCTGLTSITIPDSVTYIGVCAFLNCSHLTSITMPAYVYSIQEQAFVGSGLTSITFQNVYDIRSEAFKNCPDLVEVIINNTNRPPFAYQGAFDNNAENRLFKVVPELLNTYKTDSSYGWVPYADSIVSQQP